MDSLFSVRSKRIRFLAFMAPIVFFLALTNVSAATFEPRLFIDLKPGAASSSPTQITKTSNNIFFSATTRFLSSGELWVSDGTIEGTTLLKSRLVSELTALDDKVLFASLSELWVSNGTESGTTVVTDVFTRAPRSLVQLGDYVYFLIDDISSSNTLELWKSDGTAGGTSQIVQLSNVLALPGFAEQYSLVQSGGLLYFVLNDATNGEELWVSDGSAIGTHIVKDIRTGSLSSNPEELIDAAGLLYFSANDGVNGRELWRTDGTSANTQLVKDLLLDGGNQPENLFSDGSTLYFSAVDNNGLNREPWVSDGTPAGTQQLKEIAVIPDPLISSFPGSFQKVGASVFFNAQGDTYKTDGTAIGTELVALPFQLGVPVTEFDAEYYFSADTAIEGKEPAITDGTPLGTKVLTDINPGTEDSSPANFVALGQSLFFTANDGQTGRELWTLQKINLVRDLNQVAAGDDSIGFEVEVNSNFDTANFYAICHTANSAISPTAEHIKAGTVDGTSAALSVVSSLNVDLSSTNQTNLSCESLPNAASNYDIYIVFENAANPNEFSEVYSADQAKLRTAPQVSSISEGSRTATYAEFSVGIDLASHSSGLRVYFTCHTAAAGPFNSPTIILGQTSSGGNTIYASSKFLGESTLGEATIVNTTLRCNVSDPDATYQIAITVDDLGLNGDSFDESPTVAVFSLPSVILVSSLSSTTEKSIEFLVGPFGTTDAFIDIFVICHQGTLPNTPSAADIKAGRINAVTQATASVHNLVVNADVTQAIALTCTGLDSSQKYSIYAVFERTSNTGAYSTVKKVHEDHWRTAPQVTSVVSTQVGTSNADISIELNHQAQTGTTRVHWICDDSGLIPTAENIIAGQIVDGQLADFRGFQNVPAPINGSDTATELDVSCNNLTAGSEYSIYAIADDKGFQYNALESYQTMPAASAFVTDSKIDSIAQTGMTESQINFELDSISTAFNIVNAYIVCATDGSDHTPTPQDIKSGRVNATDFGVSSGDLINSIVSNGSFALSCDSRPLEPSTRYDIYAVFENANSAGEFSQVFKDTTTEWRTAAIINQVTADTVENEKISIRVQVQSAATSTDIRLHMICDADIGVPTAEQIIAGQNNSGSVAEVIQKLDLNAFTSLQFNQEHEFSCSPMSLGQSYNVFLIAEDLAFTKDSFQTKPSSTRGELESQDLCIPIKAKQSNAVVLLCL